MILSWCTPDMIPGSGWNLDDLISRLIKSKPGAPNFYNQKGAVMEKTAQEELKAHLIATNEEFRSLAEKHAQLHQRLEDLEAKQRPTTEDEAEEQRLKKQKLRVKDQMNEVMARYKAQQVA
jgi:uncharacterized protein YdcH (DUF465 family)